VDNSSDLIALARRLHRRFDHASSRGQALADSIATWMSHNEIEMRPVIAEDRLSWELWLDVNHPPLDEWGNLFNDGIHATRTMLDHLTWGLATMDGRAPERPKSVQFPVARTRKDWKNESRKIAELDPRARQAIEEVQPFQRDGQSLGPERDPLLLLSEFDNVGKHRIILDPGINPQEVAHEASVEFGSAEIAAQEGPPQILFDLGSIPATRPLLRWVTQHPIVRVKGGVRLHAQVQVVLEPDKAYGVTSVLGELLDYAGRVTNHVLAAIQRGNPSR
jgi:hypothetical protein